MLEAFAETNQLGASFDARVAVGPPLVAAASFRTDAFFRVWYLSDGKSFALATYTCALENEARGESNECEDIVRTVNFD
jgi:hypothetical protein